MPRSRPPTNLLDVLSQRALRSPRQVAFTFAGREHGYGELWQEIERLAGNLAATGVEPGDRVVLVLPNGPGFFAAFYATQLAGAVPVPVFPESGAERVRDLAAACDARLVVVAAAATETLAMLAGAGGSGAGRSGAGASTPSPAVLAVGGVTGSGIPAHGSQPPRPARRDVPPPRPDDPALIQYTSGSTGDPKGVVITHGNLLTNVRQMIAGMEITEDDVFVSWLPVHHDMGLVLMTMVPFYLGARLVLLPSSLTDVRVWLHAIAAHRGTFTAAPDFAYRLCLRAVRDPSRFDLSSLRVALNAAEPVRATTIRRFHAAFGLDDVMVAGYGLAEATVGVSMQPPGTPPVVSERGQVAIGRPFPGIALHVLGEGGRPAASGEVGELIVESPANTAGYYRNPKATAELFWRPGAIRTGDLGYRDGDGNLFLVGRSKNIILQAGRNLAPAEIEETVESLPFVRRAAAVGIDRGRAEGEQAYVFAELRRAKPPDGAELQEMARQVVVSFHRRLGLRPGRVLLLEPRSIPLTPNGKIRHLALRAAYLEGHLREHGHIVYPPG